MIRGAVVLCCVFFLALAQPARSCTSLGECASAAVHRAVAYFTTPVGSVGHGTTVHAARAVVDSDLFITSPVCSSTASATLRILDNGTCTQLGAAPLVTQPNACSTFQTCTVSARGADNIVTADEMIRCMFNGLSVVDAAYVASVYANGTVSFEMWIGTSPVICTGAADFAYTFDASAGCTTIETAESPSVSCMSTAFASPSATTTTTGNVDLTTTTGSGVSGDSGSGNANPASGVVAGLF